MFRPNQRPDKIFKNCQVFWNFTANNRFTLSPVPPAQIHGEGDQSSRFATTMMAINVGLSRLLVNVFFSNPLRHMRLLVQ